MKRKMVASLMTLAMTASVFGGFSTVAQAEDDVTLSMWVWDDAQVPATQAMIDEFQEANPNIKIEITSIAGVTDYNTKMQSVIGTADAPEIFWMNFNLAKEYIPMGFVQDLTEWIDGDESFDLSGLNAGITDAYTVDGSVYGIVKDTDAYAVFYNKALFDEAGVEYPSDSWTTDDFAEITKNLTTDAVKGFANSTTDRVWYNFMYAFGGSPYTEDGSAPNVNSEGSVAAVQYLMDLMNGGYTFTGPELTEISSNVAFESNMCAMVIDGSWMVSEFATALGDNLGIAELPEGPAGRGSCGHGIAYATTTSNEHPEETWKFLSYLGSDAAQEKQVEVVIPAANACASTWEAVYPNLNLTAFVNALSYNKPYLGTVNATAARTTFQEYQANVLAGMYADAQEAMDATQAAMESAMAQ